MFGHSMRMIKRPIDLLFLETVGHYEFLDGPIDEELQSRGPTRVAADQRKNCNVRGGGSSVRSDKESLRLTDLKSHHAASQRTIKSRSKKNISSKCCNISYALRAYCPGQLPCSAVPANCGVADPCRDDLW